MQGRKGDDEIRAKMAELVMVCDKESKIRQQRLQNATLSLHKSLHSSKSNADQTISINGMAAQLRFVNRHNSVVGIDLSDQEQAYYHPILAFLRRSRVHYVLTHNPPVMIDYVRQFWAIARFDCTVNPSVIRAKVYERDIAFSSDNLRDILHLGTEAQDNGPVEFPAEMRMGAFQRMGYVGDLTKSPYIKSFLYGQWRYLMHVLIQCISARKAGFDAMNARLQSLMISLVYNKPYSISRFFFDEFRQQIEGVQRDRFLLYPRFIMMIILHFLPDIPSLENTVQVSVVDRRIFADCKVVKANRPAHQQPQETQLFGYLLDPNYVAPPNDGWLDVQQADQPEGDVQDVVGEGQQQPQPQAAEQALPQAHQEVLEDVLQQLEQPQPQGADPIDPAVAEAVVQEVIQQDDAHDVEHDDDVFAEIDAYEGGAEHIEPMDVDDASKEGANDSAKDSKATKGNDDGDDSNDDGEDSDDDGEGGYVLTHYGSKVIAVARSDPPDSSSRVKRKLNDDDDYKPDFDDSSLVTRRSKRVARTGGIVISKTTEQAATTTTTKATIAATTTTTKATIAATQPEITTSVPFSQPSSSIPSSSLPTFTVPDTLRISELEGKFLVLNTRVTSLNAQLAAQNVAHSAQVASLTQQLDLSNSRVESLTGQVERLVERADAQRLLILKLEEMLNKLVAQGGNLTCKEDELRRVREDDRDDDPNAPKDGELPSSSTKLGSLPKIASNPQETTIISMSAPFSSVSTDSGSSAKDDHSRQANRVGRKLRNVQGIQSSVLSPGSASSLRRSPRFKVKK